MFAYLPKGLKHIDSKIPLKGRIYFDENTIRLNKFFGLFSGGEISKGVLSKLRKNIESKIKIDDWRKLSITDLLADGNVQGASIEMFSEVFLPSFKEEGVIHGLEGGYITKSIRDMGGLPNYKKFGVINIYTTATHSSPKPYDFFRTVEIPRVSSEDRETWAWFLSKRTQICFPSFNFC